MNAKIQNSPKLPHYPAWNTPSGTVPGGHAKGESDPRFPRKMPGLPKGLFLEKPAKHPDSIRGIYGIRSARYARCAVFIIWVNFLFKKGWLADGVGPGKKACQTAIRGSGGHYMRPEFGVFWQSGHDM
jgi:hypothetical protein